MIAHLEHEVHVRKDTQTQIEIQIADRDFAYDALMEMMVKGTNAE